MRAVLLLLIAFGAGMALIIGGFVVHIRGEWEDDAPLTAAIAALLLSTSPGWCSAAASGATTCSRCSRRPRCARRCWRGGRASAASRCGPSSRPRPCRPLLPGRLGGVPGLGLQEFDEVDTGDALAGGRRARRHAGRVRRPRGPAAHQRDGLALPAPVEPADAHPGPGPRRAARLVAGPDAADVARRVGAVRHLVDRAAAPSCEATVAGAVRRARHRLRPTSDGAASEPCGC